MSVRDKWKNSRFIRFVKKFYATHILLKLFLTCVLAMAVIGILVMIPVWQVKKNEVEKSSSRELKGGEEISREKGNIKVAENGGRELYFDTETMEVSVVDTKSGETFSSFGTDASEGKESALLTVSYLGEDNNINEWNSYDNCTALSSYQLYQIEDGIRIDMNLNEGESNRFYEYLPKKMSVERYEQVFKGGIEAKEQAGELTKEEADRYMRTLSLVYKKSIKEECYAVTYAGNPPVNAVNQMIEVANLVGYTKEMLMEDADQFSFTVSFTEPAVFDLSLEITLEDGDLVVHMPTGDMVSENDYYTIQNVAVMPNFGSVTAEACDEGYILVPDGAGALFEFNAYQADVTQYSRPFYDNDYYTDYYFMPEYGEELTMPIFGMLYGENEKGFLGIVEEGAYHADVTVNLAGTGEDSSKYNGVWTSFDINQYTKVKINGAYSEDAASYLVDTGMQKLDCTVRYRFYGDGVTYYTMAKDYQSYLAEKEGMQLAYNEGDAAVYLEAIGAVSIEERIAGIPYNRVYSMTSYEELLSIMEDLSGISLNVQYDGAFNGGINGRMNTKADLVKQNGSREGLDELTAKAEEKGVPLYFGVALSKVYESGNGFMSSRHAVRDFSNEAAQQYRYNPALGIQSGALYDGISHDGYYTVAPSYLNGVVDGFLEDSEGLDRLAVMDLADMYYADYRFDGMVSGEEGNAVLEANLKRLAEQKELALANPYMDKISYGSIAVGVSRESSDYTTFAHTIPFKQLVLNGLMEYTSEDVNLSSRHEAYFILQAAETGTWPKYTVTAKSNDVLKDTDYNYLYASEYAKLSDRMKEVYEACEEIRSQIGTNEIVDHTILMDQVYQTTYATGVRVAVNYNPYPVTLEDGSVLEAESYLIEGGTQ
ncbi:MAG TPA: hypothetical protein IAB48_09630 [Candidatus Fimimorpha excrementavium]|nr:hypothetical protein [Candidatus Fimimorpha excrementavium]